MASHFEQITIAPLTGPAEDFAPFTYPRFRPALSQLSEDGAQTEDISGTIHAVGARNGEQPIGLALIQVLPKTAERKRCAARVLSVMVGRHNRQDGVGKALLRFLEQYAGSQGALDLFTQYSAQTKERAAFEALLSSCGWSPPALLEFRLSGHADWTERVADLWRPMLARMHRQGYSSTPWADITDADRSDAEAVVSEGLIHPLLDFKLFEPHMDPAVSIALRQNDKLVGWVLGETLPSTGYHHYTCGHVRPKLQRSGWLIGGIYDVCVLQHEAYGAKSVAAYETFGENTAMINFMRRKLSDVTLWMDERFQSSKPLVKSRQSSAQDQHQI